MKKSLLYIGNKSGVGNATVTTIDTLSEQLKVLGYGVVTASAKQHKLERLVDMLFTVFKKRNTTDVVLIDTYSTLNFQYARLVGRLCSIFKIPYIPILHGGDLPSRLERSPSASRRLFGNAHVNVAPSKYLLDAFIAKGYQNVTYIPNTIAIKKYPFKSSNTPACKLLWVRSFSEIYNPLLALDIVAELQKNIPEVSLCMVGPEKDGSLQKCKESAAKRGLPVTFTGMLSKEAWIALAADFDVFINTTNFDNMPVSIIEAMALGLPIVTTNVGGIPYLVDQGEGILVPPNNPKEFARAIISVINDLKGYARLKNAARQKAETFDWDAVKKSWMAILDF